jgi:hypothetical protein
LFALLLLAVTANIGTVPQNVAAQGGATVNVPAAILVVDCPFEWAVSDTVLMAHMQLNGEVMVFEGTANNGALVYINGIPAVVFEQLSINWRDFDVIYRFIAGNGEYVDIAVPAGRWNRDAQSGVIYQGFGC